MLRQPEFRSGSDISLKVGDVRRPLSPEQVHHLVQIAYETLANAMRHARVSRISLEVTYKCDAVVMTVQDNGQGLPYGGGHLAQGPGTFQHQEAGGNPQGEVHLGKPARPRNRCACGITLPKKVIFLAAFPDDENLLEAIEAGADGYVLKLVGIAELLEALEKVRRGENMLDSSLMAQVFARLGEVRQRERGKR